MKNHKLTKVLNSINHSDQKDFEAWLFGKSRGKKSITQNLLQLIIKKGATKWEDKKVWKSLFKSTAFNSNRYNKEMFNLFTPFMEFLPFIQFKKDEKAKTIYRLKALNQPGMEAEFQSLWKKEVAPTINSQRKTTKDWYFLYQAEVELHQNRLRNPLSSKRTNFPFVNKTFAQYWMLQSLQFACHTLSHNNIHGEKDQADANIFNDILPIIDQQVEVLSQPIYKVYRNIYRLLSGSWNGDILQIIDEQKENLHPSDLHDAFSFILNFYTREINQGIKEESFFRKLIKIYEWGYSYKFLHSEEGLKVGHFRNIASICFRIEANELARKFSEEWKEELPEKYREIAFDFNMAHYYFYIGDYSKAREIIINQPKGNSFHTIHLRIIELRIVYEKKYAPYNPIGDPNDPQKLINQIKALQKYIKSQGDLSEIHKIGYHKRLNIFTKLLTAKTINGLLKLKREIENDHSIDHSRWLYSKVLQRLKKEFGISDE